MHFRLVTVLAAAWLGAAASPALAQRSVGGGFTITGRATAITDYRYRGISQSDGDPALQATATISHDSGLYAGLWGSSLTDVSPNGEVELEYYAGYAREISPGTDVDVGLLYTTYPDATALTDTDYLEGYASLSHTLGPVTAEVGTFYAPEQNSLGGNDNIYLYGELTAGIPTTPFSAVGHLGYSSGGLVPGGGEYLDWSLGVEVDRGPFRLGLTYVDTDLNLPNTDGTLVASLSVGF